jgi:hypothetical protein
MCTGAWNPYHIADVVDRLRGDTYYKRLLFPISSPHLPIPLTQSFPQQPSPNTIFPVNFNMASTTSNATPAQPQSQPSGNDEVPYLARIHFSITDTYSHSERSRTNVALFRGSTLAQFDKWAEEEGRKLAVAFAMRATHPEKEENLRKSTKPPETKLHAKWAFHDDATTSIHSETDFVDVLQVMRERGRVDMLMVPTQYYIFEGSII